MTKFRKVLLAAAMMGLAAPFSAWAGTTGSTASVSATVDTFAEWDDTAPSIASADWDGNINATSQTRTASKALTLYANVNTTITPSAGTNAGVLTNGTDTLTTAYQITGDVGTPDGSYKAAGTGIGQFFEASNTYTVTHVGGDGAYALSLGAQATSDSGRAHDAGTYTAGLTLTATW